MVNSFRIGIVLRSGAALFVAAGIASAAVTVVVTSTADVVTSCSTTGVPAVGTGGCTLRDAILYSNANPATAPALNLIQFNIPGIGVQTISLSSDLTPITTATIVDGYSQPGSSPNTLAVGDDAVLQIRVFGVVLPDGTGVQQSCMSVSGGTGSVIQGLSVDHGASDTSSPLSIDLSSCCNRVVGNFIGLDPLGSASLGSLRVGSDRNQVGSVAPADRNVITCPRDDNGGVGPPSLVDLVGDSNSIEGNYIGTNTAGNGTPCGFALGPQLGLTVEGSANFIHRNLISTGYSEGGGIAIAGTGNAVSGNLIGTDASGTVLLHNPESGIFIDDSGSGNTIGASTSTQPLLGFLFQGNTIAGSGLSGINVRNAAVGNSILSNSLFSNSFGIDLTTCVCAGDGPTPNDPGDGDSGANNLQNYPVLTQASGILKTSIQGTLSSAASTTYRIQLFSSSSCSSSGFGEGETLVDEASVTTDGSGNASIKDSIFPRIPPGRFVTATATDPSGNTSEFSRCVLVTAIGPPPPPPFPTITRLLEDGPVRVPPGVPVEFLFGVEAQREARQAAAGVVLVSDEAGHSCESTLIRSGVGACPLTFRSEGSYHVQAHYEGLGDFLPSDSDKLVVVVKAGNGD